MSENGDTDNWDKTSENITRKMNSKGKEKRRKRKRTDQPEETLESKESPKQSDEIEDNDEADGVEEKKPKEPSKRQLKREKIEKQHAEQREASKLEAAKKALNYISKWKHAKNDWKFEKLRQIWLIDHLLDETLVPDPMFQIALEYFEGSKGMARQQLIKKTMVVIKKFEDLNEAGENEEKETTNNSEYHRARQILQALPTEG